MKIPSATLLIMFTYLLWAIVTAEAFLDLLDTKQFALGLGGAVALAFICITRRHAERVEKVTREHAAVLAKQVLTIERFFAMGALSDNAARFDARSRVNGSDTGPLAAYRRAF